MILPFCTVATFVFEENHFTPDVFAVRDAVSPSSIVRLDFEIPVEVPLRIVTLQEEVLLPSLTVSVTVPADLAVIIPDESIEAAFVFEIFQVGLLAPVCQNAYLQPV